AAPISPRPPALPAGPGTSTHEVLSSYAALRSGNDGRLEAVIPAPTVLRLLYSSAIVCPFPLAQHPLPQGIIDGRLAQHSWHHHGRKARPQHRQEQREAGRHLGDPNDAGGGGPTK